jgi:hypothetical protein
MRACEGWHITRTGCGRVHRSGSATLSTVSGSQIWLRPQTLLLPISHAEPIESSAVSGAAGMTEVLKGKARRLHEQFSS